MSKSPAFQFYATDFYAGTSDMSAEEVGAYIRLLCYQWDKGLLPNDDEKLARIAGCGGNAVASIRHKFGICQDGAIRNARLERVREVSLEYRAKQAQNAKNGWKNRKKDGLAMPPHMPDPMPDGCQTDALLLQSPIKEIDVPREGLELGSEPETTKATHPTEAQVIAHAAAAMPPIPAPFALAWVAEMEGAGWIDRHQRPVHPTRWKRALEGAARNSANISSEIAARRKFGQGGTAPDPALHRKKSRFGF